jgi:hypothetical protein
LRSIAVALHRALSSTALLSTRFAQVAYIASFIRTFSFPKRSSPHDSLKDDGQRRSMPRIELIAVMMYWHSVADMNSWPGRSRLSEKACWIAGCISVRSQTRHAFSRHRLFQNIVSTFPSPTQQRMRNTNPHLRR